MDLKNAVNLARDGKEEGYNYLYQQTYQKSYYVALKYMKQEDAALDVLQEAYIKAFKNLEQLQDADKFPAWFAKVVASKALDELKKRKVVLFSQMETEDFTVETMFEDDRIDTQPELSLDKKETSRLVQEMISTLSDEQRICIMMLYVEEMSVKEIAETLGVSENTVKSRLNYGRKNIKEKVVEMEKKGTKLYGLAPIPFFLYLLLSDSMNVQAAELPANNILETASKEAVKARQGAGALTQPGRKVMGIMSKKVIIGIAASIVVVGGTTVGIFAYQTHQNKLAGEAVAVHQEEANAQLEKSTETITEEPTETPEEPTTEPTETPEEPTTEPTEAPTEEPTKIPEEVASQSEEIASQFTYIELSQTMYAKSSANVRDLPSTDGNKIGGISTGDEVNVVAQCNETSWYRIDYSGSTGYVSNNYLVKDKPVAEQPVAQNTDSGQASTPTEQPVQPETEQPATDYPVPMFTIIDTGDSFYFYAFLHERATGYCGAETSAIGAQAEAYAKEKFGGNYSWTECTEHIDWNGKLICKRLYTAL